MGRVWPGTESNRRHEDFQSSALPTELPGQKFGILLKRSRESRLALRFTILFCPVLDEVHQLTFQANAVQRINLLDTCGAGNIDFGKITADDIQADKVEAILSKQRR